MNSCVGGALRCTLCDPVPELLHLTVPPSRSVHRRRPAGHSLTCITFIKNEDSLAHFQHYTQGHKISHTHQHVWSHTHCTMSDVFGPLALTSHARSAGPHDCHCFPYANRWTARGPDLHYIQALTSKQYLILTCILGVGDISTALKNNQRICNIHLHPAG